MLAAARHSAILEEVQRERIVRVADLAKMLGVSLMTVRRDIEALDAAGAVDFVAPTCFAGEFPVALDEHGVDALAA